MITKQNQQHNSNSLTMFDNWSFHRLTLIRTLISKAMKRFSLLFIAALFYNVLAVSAQNQNPPTDKRLCTEYDATPQTLSAILSGRIQPDLNTGTLKLDIPVYTWSDPDFTLPVALTYSTNGFKPARSCGPVGLGWSLNLGGVITRVIHGIDDFKLHYGRYYSGGMPDDMVYDLSIPFNYDGYSINAISSAGCEIAADVFSFSFCDHVGSFMLDAQNQFIVFNTHGGNGTYSIVYDPEHDTFIISTDDGYKYYFGSSSASREVLYDINPLYFQQREVISAANEHEDRLTTVSWCLDKIIAPNGRELTFTYTMHNARYSCPNNNEDAVTTFGRGYNYFYTPNWNAPQLPGQTEPSLFLQKYLKHLSIIGTTYIQDVRIKEPTSDSTYTIMSLGYSNKPYKELAQNTSSIYSTFVTLQKQLDYIRIMNHDNELVGGADLSFAYNTRRSLLASVNIHNVGNYQMEYNADYPLVDILTNAQDYWGFYNGRTANTDAHIVPVSIETNFDEIISTPFMAPDARYSVLGTLKSIVYPTGGKTEFEYEANDAQFILLRKCSTMYLPALYSYREFTGSNVCGGVRIRSITDIDKGEIIYKRTYAYELSENGQSSGIILKFRRYFGETYIQQDQQSIISPLTGMIRTPLLFPDNSFDEAYLAYSRVTEHYPDGSFTAYRFSDYQDYPDEFSPHFNMPSFQIDSDNEYYVPFTTNAFREPDSRHYRRGKLIKIEYFSNNNTLLKSIDYEYEDSDDKYSAYIVDSGCKYWSARRYMCDFLLKRQIETIYDTDTIVLVWNFEYNSYGQLKKESVTDLSGQNGYTTYLRYCHENTLSEGMSLLKGPISDRLSTRTINGTEYLLSNSRMTYDRERPNIQPSSVTEYDIDIPIECTNISMPEKWDLGRNGTAQTHTTTFNTLLRPLDIKYSGGNLISYLWDDRGINPLRVWRDGKSQSISYEWKDMVGPTKVIYSDGTEETYEYDDKNRLKRVYDIFNIKNVEYEYYIENE